MNKQARSSRGFTIVELLIVIIVIAILASITLVTYGGIQQRANNATTINSVAAYAKAIQLYAVQNGVYPDTTGNPCLGPLGTRCINMTDYTGACNNYGSTTANSTFDTAIKSVAPSIPAPSTQTATCGGKQYGGAFYAPAGSTSRIIYFLSGSVTCSAAGLTLASQVQVDSVTICSVIFPTLS